MNNIRPMKGKKKERKIGPNIPYEYGSKDSK